MITKIFYSIQNGGDGSAYPVFFDSLVLAELDQKYMYEGWGESCTGSISIDSNGPVKVSDVETIEMVEARLVKEYEYDENDQYNVQHLADVRKLIRSQQSTKISTELYEWMNNLKNESGNWIVASGEFLPVNVTCDFAGKTCFIKNLAEIIKKHL